ncbi:hypothetical protein LMG31886_18770 [Xanthomonas hydrangeae]|nr:hypothetical protein LMG31886_18770 [Xanthomonas hydrangeae]CAD7733290.1 hypothetical protein LMG31886_18770 [Xanthomonas hydrangeae]CAD7746422.1 hypothetical protein LMG31885_41460 [Xanthomonas hydrangeae]CAD7746424.1 hypothetical protein LMG31885_41460 [Xanthomonas hydrangeae]
MVGVHVFNKATDSLSGAVSSPLAGPCGGMDAATEPYLFAIWQFRCREPAWATVRAWISAIAV